MKKFFTVEEVAPYFHTSVWTIYRRIKEGAIACVHAGGGRNMLIPAQEVRRFLSVHGLPIPDELAAAGERIRVLLVDDDEKIVRSLTRYFARKELYELRSATSGFAAGLAIPEFKPQVILLDIMLGDMDGRELVKTVKADPQHGAPRVIALSGYVRDEESASLLAGGFDDYLAKPFTPQDLIERIERVLVRPAAR